MQFDAVIGLLDWRYPITAMGIKILHGQHTAGLGAGLDRGCG